MKYIAALLLALALLAVPGLAFEPTIPVADLEKITTSMTQDNGAYSFQRIAVDAGETDTVPFSPQDVYSGMLFGAGEGTKVVDPVTGQITYRHIGYDNGPAYSAGVLANKISTDAQYTYMDPRTGKPVDQFVGVDTTRQFIQQGGSMYLTTTPTGSDSEVGKPWSVDLGFSKSNLAWISSKVDEFTVDAQSYGVVGGNFLPAVPKELSPFCKNVWLYEQENLLPTSISAVNDADLIEAYAGTASKVNMQLYPESKNNDNAKALMSGYAEKFAGYDNAEVAGNNPKSTGQTYWNDNEIVINFGNNIANGAIQPNTVENFWTAGGDGVRWNWPECPDFPNNVPGTVTNPNPLFGTTTFPDVPVPAEWPL